MITSERVISISGSRVQTDQGMRRCAGNAPVAVGDMVTVVGNLIIGWVRRAARRPVAEVPPKYYRFASAEELKMYNLDYNFADMGTEDIPRPTEDTQEEAALLLHCYNEYAEYLVWFIGSRCLIQRDSVTVADFISVFPSDETRWHLGCDGYIDDDQNLVWAGAYTNYQPSTAQWAKYVNGECINSIDFTPTMYAEMDTLKGIETQKWDALMSELNNTSKTEQNYSSYNVPTSNAEYDYNNEILWWHKSQNTNPASVDNYVVVESINVWDGICYFTIRAKHEEYLTHIKKTTRTDNAILSSVDNPRITYSSFYGGGYVEHGYYPDGVPIYHVGWRYCTHEIRVNSTAGATLSSISRTDADDASVTQGTMGLSDGISYYSGSSGDPFNPYLYTSVGKVYTYTSAPENIESIINYDSIKKVVAAAGPFEIVDITDSTGGTKGYLYENDEIVHLDFYVAEYDYHGEDFIGSCSIKLTADEVLIIFDDRGYRKKAGEPLETFPPGAARVIMLGLNIVTKRFV